MKNRTLLTTGNPKILKGTKLGYVTHILHLAPHTMSGYNTCPMATAGCSAACLNTAGRGGLFAGQATGVLSGMEWVSKIKAGELVSPIQAARIAKTKMFFEDRANFMRLLFIEIEAAERTALKANLIPVFRLNGTSDIRWETIGVAGFANVMEAFPHLQFYDYTKIANRKNIPSNYHLTFSLAESNADNAKIALENGMNVAVVFRTPDYPATYMDAPVVNGDETDLRFLDPKGCIVGLKAKGKGKKDTTGFVKENV